MNVKLLRSDLLAELAQTAGQSTRGRQHHNIHASFKDPCQKLLNAIGMGSYIRPHRHALDPKDECLVAVKGLFALIVFEEQGEVKRVERFGTEKFFRKDSGVALGVELPPGVWHTVLALEPDSVLLELKAGPFNPNAAKEFAAWAPEEGSEEASAYLAYLKSLI
jgi:cupin fold WbuC family metalloprotein